MYEVGESVAIYGHAGSYLIVSVTNDGYWVSPIDPISGNCYIIADSVNVIFVTDEEIL